MKKQGGFVPKVANPADCGKAKPLHGDTNKCDIGSKSINPGSQDMSGGCVGRGGFNTGENGSPRHLRTGTARGEGGSKPSGAKYKGNSGGGYVPGFGKK